MMHLICFKMWILSTLVMHFVFLEVTGTEKGSTSLPECQNIQDLVVGSTDRTCKVEGLVGIKGQCSLYKTCSASAEGFKLQLIKNPCPPETIFSVEQRKCINVISPEDTTRCAQSLCFSDEKEKSQSTGPIFKSSYNSKVEPDINSSSVLTISEPFVCLTFLVLGLTPFVY